MSFYIVCLEISSCNQPVNSTSSLLVTVLMISHLYFGVEVTNVLRQPLISSSMDKNNA